jgi:hypothetical protein
MAVVIDEIVTESTAESKPSRNQPSEAPPPDAHEVERIIGERHARLARVRAY